MGMLTSLVAVIASECAHISHHPAVHVTYTQLLLANCTSVELHKHSHFWSAPQTCQVSIPGGEARGFTW